jgi:hypothetical protein
MTTGTPGYADCVKTQQQKQAGATAVEKTKQSAQAQ